MTNDCGFPSAVGECCWRTKQIKNSRGWDEEQRDVNQVMIDNCDCKDCQGKITTTKVVSGVVDVPLLDTLTVIVLSVLVLVVVLLASCM